MPSKKKKYNARFPAGRIKKIMQSDEDVGKVAQAVPVIISRTLELFVESLLKKAGEITTARNAKTLTPSHLKQCILSESRFDFLKDLVKNIPDVSNADDESGPSVGAVGGAHSSTSRTPTSYGRFQFRRRSNGGISKPSTTTSQHRTISQPVLPRFYNEIEIGGEDQKKEEEEQASGVSPAIYQAGANVNHTPPSISSHGDYVQSHSLPESTATTSSTATAATNTAGASEASYILGEKNKDSSDDDEEGDEDLEENGYHKLQIVTKPCTVDEDYDA